MISPRLLVCAAASVLVACGSNATFLQTGTTRPAVAPSQVRIYSTMPPGAQQIGIVTSSDTSHFSRQKLQDSIIADLKQTAAERGANGLVITGTGSGEAGGPQLGAFMGGNTMFPSHEEKVTAIAIYVP